MFVWSCPTPEITDQIMALCRVNTSSWRDYLRHPHTRRPVRWKRKVLMYLVWSASQGRFRRRRRRRPRTAGRAPSSTSPLASPRTPSRRQGAARFRVSSKDCTRESTQERARKRSHKSIHSSSGSSSKSGSESGTGARGIPYVTYLGQAVALAAGRQVLVARIVLSDDDQQEHHRQERIISKSMISSRLTSRSCRSESAALRGRAAGAAGAAQTVAAHLTQQHSHIPPLVGRDPRRHCQQNNLRSKST